MNEYTINGTSTLFVIVELVQAREDRVMCITLTLNEQKKRPAGFIVCGGEHTHTERILWPQAVCYGMMSNALLELVTYKHVM